MKTTITICAIIALAACQNVESNSPTTGNDTTKTVGVSITDSTKKVVDTTKVVKVLKTDSLLRDVNKTKVGEANVLNIKSHA